MQDNLGDIQRYFRSLDSCDVPGELFDIARGPNADPENRGTLRVRGTTVYETLADGRIKKFTIRKFTKRVLADIMDALTTAAIPNVDIVQRDLAEPFEGCWHKKRTTPLEVSRMFWTGSTKLYSQCSEALEWIRRATEGIDRAIHAASATDVEPATDVKPVTDVEPVTDVKPAE